MRSIALFGGTFDPVHNGHLNTSITIQNHFHFDKYLFLPCANPVLKAPTVATSEQRIEMLKLAIADYDDFAIDLREITRSSPSYTVDTLESFRAEAENDALTLIMGYDAYLSLPNWSRWDQLISLANFLVMNRQQFANHHLPESIRQLTSNHMTQDKNDLLNHKAGMIFMFDAGNYEISSTAVRNNLKNNQSASQMLPDSVWEYIRKLQLYR